MKENHIKYKIFNFKASHLGKNEYKQIGISWNSALKILCKNIMFLTMIKLLRLNPVRYISK